MGVETPKLTVEGVILAAGLSSRAGEYKMTLPLGERTVIEHTIAGMCEAVERVIVVTGWQAERLQDLLADREGVDLVHNAGYRAGMFSSVRVGLAQVRAPRFLLLPGDLPLIGRRVYERLLKTPGEIVIPTFEGRRGHPVCMSSQLVPEILAQAEDSNLRAYIQGKGYDTVEVEDEGILLDLDTPEDYGRLRARFAGRCQ